MLVLAACGGDDDDTGTTAAPDDTGTDGTTTTAAAAPTTTVGDDDDGGGSGELTGACRDLIVDFLHEIEPTVEDVDFEGASLADLEVILADLETVTEEYADDLDGECPDVEDNEAARDEFLAIAEAEAPGTVGFIEFSLALGDSFVGAGDDGGVGAGASGDCETDIAAFQEYVDAGGTMMDLPLSELSTVSALAISIQSVCPADQATEFFSDPAVTAFVGQGG